VLGDYLISRAPADRSRPARVSRCLRSRATRRSRSPRLAEGWGRYATLTLETLAAKVTDQRTARIPVAQGAGPPQKVKWTSKDLHGQTNVVVPLEAVTPRTTGTAYQLATELVQIGMITNAQQFARIAEVPGIEHLDEVTSPQLGLAERENVEMFTDAEMVPIPELFHDHRTHIAAHNAARASSRYNELPDLLKRTFDNHVLAHEKLALEEALRMQQLAVMSPVIAGAAMASQPEQLQELLASLPPGMGAGMPVVGGQQPAPPQPDQPNKLGANQPSQTPPPRPVAPQQPQQPQRP
jgi:hypothetical protein